MIVQANLSLIAYVSALGLGLFLVHLAAKENSKSLRFGGGFLVIIASLLTLEGLFLGIQSRLGPKTSKVQKRPVQTVTAMSLNKLEEVHFWCKKFREDVETCEGEHCTLLRPLEDMCLELQK
jgi:hypothetical protein